MNTADVSQEILTAKEAAEVLRTPLRTIYALIERGEIPAIKLGRRRLILRTVIDGILAQGLPNQTVILEDDDI